jgi:Protein tyrosine and serine/threonine kinase
MCVQEAGLMVSLRHPNIISFMAMCTEPHAAIITDYCSNGR